MSPIANDLLDRLTEILVKERDKAIERRRATGLEDRWRKARMRFDGKDPSLEEPEATKGRTLDDPLVYGTARGEESEFSTAVVNIVRPYAQAGAARVQDIVFPAGNKSNWGLETTPMAESSMVAGLVRAFPSTIGYVPPELAARVNQTDEERSAAMDVAKRAIQDNLIEGRVLPEARKQVVECAKVGTGVLKGPFPKEREVSSDVLAFIASLEVGAELEQDPMLRLELETAARVAEVKFKNQPVGECIPVEHCYPDPGCGDDVHKGKFFWEEIPHLSSVKLQDMASLPNYNREQIDKCLREGPRAVAARHGKREQKSFTVWLRTGQINVTRLKADVKGEGSARPQSEDETVFVQVEMCNDRIIKVNLLPLDSKDFPYRFLLWEPRDNSWDGIGIAEQLESPQRGLNASARAGNDNMGWSVGFQLLIREGLISPLRGDSFAFRKYKMWKIKDETLAALSGTQTDPKMAIDTIEFPNHLDKILPWINFWLQMAESTTGLPLILQGQKSSDSVGVSQGMMRNVLTTLRMVVKRWDDDVWGPFIQDMYSWVQKYGPDEARGDATARALGSNSLAEKETHQQLLLQLLSMSTQPVFGLSPKEIMTKVLEIAQIDAGELQMTEEEERKLAETAQQPDPKVQVEQLRSQTDIQVATIKAQVDRMEALLDAQMKGLSLQQAQEAVETQTMGNVALAAVKEEGVAGAIGNVGGSESGGDGEPTDEEVSAALVQLGMG